ncbi:MAG: 16S rRNA (guanine(966)-N(2))-methyltransferase RsmD [Rhodanobacteraceae bacterium]|nr:16S rRNA (guanine(966)-N(2))-methyltransferase RsmD [Pseudomonadota bacterium]
MSRSRHITAPPGRVRIIGGCLRGSRLAVPTLPGLRPTPDRLRETLFNWLMPVIDGARALDLFAGSGALGIEALSRGAALALLVERGHAQAAAIESDLARLHVDGGEVHCGDALTMLAREPPRPFDIVFLDPPFDAGLWAPVAQALEAGRWLAPGALVYIESPQGAAFALPPAWTPHRLTRVGAVSGALYRRA